MLMMMVMMISLNDDNDDDDLHDDLNPILAMMVIDLK